MHPFLHYSSVARNMLLFYDLLSIYVYIIIFLFTLCLHAMHITLQIHSPAVCCWHIGRSVNWWYTHKKSHPSTLRMRRATCLTMWTLVCTSSGWPWIMWLPTGRVLVVPLSASNSEQSTLMVCLTAPLVRESVEANIFCHQSTLYWCCIWLVLLGRDIEKFSLQVIILCKPHCTYKRHNVSLRNIRI